MNPFLIHLLLTLVNYFVITTTIDSLLVGILHFRLPLTCQKSAFLITEENRTDMQTGNKCSAFASAYLLRHWGIEAHGDSLYEVMPCRLKSGLVFSRGITKLLSKYGFRVKYCSGSLNALKNEVSKGNPVIILLRVRVGKSWLHFVPVVGYDDQYIYIADSARENVNCNHKYYNRKIPIRTFQKLWNTGMFRMPLYRNTYFEVDKKE
ncbi:MAG: C39 family peptidase [Lachnospiraceae bacterium]|nr:C39 family peptidase [Lachnospiraceae bacterium]